MKKILATLVAGAALSAGATPLAAQGYATSVAADESQVFVGESLNERDPGYIYVYSREGGEWTEGARLQASDATAGDHFGRTLARTGNQLLTGATVRNESVGAVYVLTQDAGGNWIESQILTASDGAPGDAFGRAMAVDGDVALVATWAHMENRGAVYVFRRDASGTWNEEAKLLPDDIEPDDWFGMGLAVRGDVAVVGTPQKNDNTGMVHVFRRGDDGQWAVETTLTGNASEVNSGFGQAIWTDGHRILVSAPSHNQFRGVVHTFAERGDGEWREGPTLAPFDGGNPGTQFGAAVSEVDGEIWISAQGADNGAGSVYIHEVEDGAFTGVRKYAADGVEAGDQFGAFFAMADGVGVMSATGDDFGAGTAVIVERTASGDWTTAARVWTEKESIAAMTGSQVDCTDGEAGVFGCDEVDVLSFVPVSDIGGERGIQVNDIWGWTDPDSGKEYALVGRYNGTSFVDVSNPYSPVYIGNLEKTAEARANVWRDMKVYQNHAYIVSDGAGQHGMQVFDLTRLRDFDGEPIEFTEDAHYDEIASAHNIVINEETGFAYAVGASSGGTTCGGGLHMIDIRSPKEPTFAGCFSDPSTGRSGTGYSHDAQCVTYNGPDTEHAGKEVCFGSNETALSIADVSDKDNPIALAQASYPNVGYSHQGWLDEEQRYFYMNDELDELQGKVSKTRTLIWDVADLDDPVLAREFFSDNESSDHNLYIKDNLMYQSNYVSGLRIFDITDRENPVPAGHFDTVPWGDDAPGFDGSWSNYPYFASGIVVVTSGQEGLFVLKRKNRPIS